MCKTVRAVCAFLLILCAPAIAGTPAEEIVEVDEVIDLRNAVILPSPVPRSAALPDAFPAARLVALPALLPGDEVGAGGTNPLINGRVYEIQVNSDIDGTWLALPDGSQLWTLAVSSPNAAGLRIRFDPFNPPRGTEVVVYNAANPVEAHGPLRRHNPDEFLPYWTPILHGAELRVEWHVPAEVAAGGVGRLLVTGAAQIFPYPPGAAAGEGGGPEGGGCQLDVTCQSAWQTTAQSVGQYSYISGGQSFICSGAMINRTPSDLCPLFLTAAHCIANNAEAASIDITWFFQTSVCNGTPPNPATLPDTTWSIVLARDPDSDICLLGLDVQDMPNGLTWAGWSSAVAPDPTPATLIHHPLGMRKSWSTGELLGIEDITQCPGDASDTYDFELFDGGQDGGSSGAPVFDNSNHRIRAVATCSESDNCIPDEDTGEGALAYGYSTIAEYLQAANDVWVNKAWSGGENGSQAFPWNSLIEGFYGVSGGGTIHIIAGNYSGPFTFAGSRAMTLRAENGIVYIGQ